MVEEVMTKEDIKCPKCGSFSVSITGNVSLDTYFCKCDNCKHEFECWVIGEL